MADERRAMIERVQARIDGACLGSSAWMEAEWLIDEIQETHVLVAREQFVTMWNLVLSSLTSSLYEHREAVGQEAFMHDFGTELRRLERYIVSREAAHEQR